MTEHPLSFRPGWRALVALLPLAFACGDDGGSTKDTGPYDEDGDGVYAADDCDDFNEGVGAPDTWYADVDEDGYGDAGNSQPACGQPSGFVDNGEDCDDSTEFISPIAKERCDDLDNNCNDQVDEDAFDATLWYPDVDEDEYGDAASPEYACDAPDGYLEDGTDCNDADAEIHPGVCEVCGDDTDNDCDGIEVCDALNEAFTVMRGVSAGDAAGSEVKGNLDLNGDTFGDMLVGAPGAGKVYAVFGPVGGEISLSTADSWVESAVESGMGTAISAFGDADGDGYDEAILGQANYDVALLWLGPDMDFGARISAEELGDLAGYTVTRAGDIDDDGTTDLFIGSPNSGIAAEGGGAVYTVYGPISADLSLGDSDGVWYGSVEGLQAGEGLAGVGDMNGDGTDDLMFGIDGSLSTSRQTGAVYVLFGPAEGLNDTSDIDVKWFGEYTGDLASYPSSVGDLSGDGNPDVAVSAPGATEEDTEDSGVIYIWNGAAYNTIDNVRHGDAILTGAADGDALGLPHGGAVEGTGDLNADGFGDLWIGATASDEAGTDAGAAYVLFGPLTGSVTLCSSQIHYFGEAANDAAGTSATGAGDVDGDDVPDLLVGAPGNDEAGSNAGAAYLVLGASW